MYTGVCKLKNLEMGILVVAQNKKKDATNVPKILDDISDDDSDIGFDHETLYH
jgi:hypothetical protein